jgi:predicted GTPase
MLSTMRAAFRTVASRGFAAAAKERVLILGAAGRDFQNFNTFFRGNPEKEVVGFTATQIPKIDGRMYPAELCGELYPEGLPIWREEDMEKLIEEHKVDTCMLAYSDLSHATVMDIGSRVLSTGASFKLLGHKETMIKSTKPVVAVTATRTGCGKSQTTRFIVNRLKEHGLKAVVVRHPMPYGDLAASAVQRFGCYDDLEKHNVTIEEREEYETHLENGTVVYAGVDFERILRAAEEEADVVMWDGGNNDTPFFKPDKWFVVADPFRAMHSVDYYPGAVNFRAADVIVVNKANTSGPEGVEIIKKLAAEVNPKAKVIVGASEVTVDAPEAIKGKRVLLVDDGPTMTHGEMEFGAATVAAEKYGAGEIVDPRPVAVGTIKEVYEKYTHLGACVPAMGYFPEQIADLEATIKAAGAEAVILGTPMDLRKLIDIDTPVAAVRYDYEEMEAPFLATEVDDFVAAHCK